MAARGAGKLFLPVYSYKYFRVKMSTLSCTPKWSNSEFIYQTWIFKFENGWTGKLSHAPTLKDIASKEKNSVASERNKRMVSIEESIKQTFGRRHRLTSSSQLKKNDENDL